MLTAQPPADILIDWAAQTKIVNHAHDRPWYHTEPPLSATEFYQPPCRCSAAVKLLKYPCEDGAGYMYLGQCSRCQTIIWSFLECAGK